MIGRQHRFHGHGSLRYVYQHGKSVRGQQLGLRSVANSRRSAYRLAVVVSKKVSKSAVVRNRIRRRVYEVVRKHESEITKPYDIIISVFSDNVATMPAAELERLICVQLQTAGVITSY